MVDTESWLNNSATGTCGEEPGHCNWHGVGCGWYWYSWYGVRNIVLDVNGLAIPQELSSLTQLVSLKLYNYLAAFLRSCPLLVRCPSCG